MLNRRGIRWPLVIISSCLGTLLGTLSACAFFTLSFIIAGLAFRGGWMAYPAAFILALLAALVGWVLGGYLPTLLPVILAAEERFRSWAATTLLTTLAGALLLSGMSALWPICMPHIAAALQCLVLPLLLQQLTPAP